MLVTQSCSTLCKAVDCSLPGSSVYEILQARILVWLAISFSRRSLWLGDWTQVSYIEGIYLLSEPLRKLIKESGSWACSLWSIIFKPSHGLQGQVWDMGLDSFSRKFEHHVQSLIWKRKCLLEDVKDVYVSEAQKAKGTCWKDNATQRSRGLSTQGPDRHMKHPTCSSEQALNVRIGFSFS